MYPENSIDSSKPWGYGYSTTEYRKIQGKREAMKTKKVLKALETVSKALSDTTDAVKLLLDIEVTEKNQKKFGKAAAKVLKQANRFGKVACQLCNLVDENRVLGDDEEEEYRYGPTPSLDRRQK